MYIWGLFLSILLYFWELNNQLMKTRRRLELLLEGLSAKFDHLDEIYENANQLLEPLLLCHESLVSFFYFTLILLDDIYLQIKMLIKLNLDKLGIKWFSSAS
jgi:hypothetical protein